MPSTIKVMSWNIQNIGSKKLKVGPSPIGTIKEGKNYTLKFIKTVIDIEKPDVVAIMEILSSKGTFMGKEIKAKLPDTWKVQESSPQRHISRHEQYLYLWNESPAGTPGIEGPLETDYAPSPCWTYGVVDNNSLSSFFKSLGSLDTADKRKEIFLSLKQNQYIELERSVDKNALESFKTSVAALKEGDADYIFSEDPPGSSDDEEGDPEEPDNLEDIVLPKSRTTTSLAKQKEVDYTSVYITYRLNAEYWNDMVNEDATFVLEDSSGKETLLGMSEDQVEDLGEKLKLIDIVLFPSVMERGPFLLQLNLKDTANADFPLLLGVLHAPAPGKESEVEAEVKEDLGTKRKAEEEGGTKSKTTNQSKFEAINNLALCTPFKNATNLLLMGDFNLTGVESTLRVYDVPVYERARFSDGKYKFGKTMKTETLNTGFEKITGTLKATDLIGPAIQTSIKTQQSAATMSSYNPAGWGNLPADYTANPYDRFFLRKQPTNFDSNQAQLVDLIAKMMPGNAALNPNLAEAGMKFLRWNARLDFIDKAIEALQKTQTDLQKLNPKGAFVDKNTKTPTKSPELKRQKALVNAAQTNQQKIAAIDNQILFLNNLKAVLNDPTKTAPTNNITAYIAYSLLSDHLPISVNIQYGV
jgi:hypothetical protein